MKKILIGTTALVAAGFIASSANAAPVMGNSDINNVTFSLTGDVEATVAIAKQKDLDDARMVDIWSKVSLAGQAKYENKDAEALVKSVTGNFTLYDGDLQVGTGGALDGNVAINTKFGNVIIGSADFTGAMGVIGEEADSAGSDFFSNDTGRFDANGDAIEYGLDLTDNDLADGSEHKIQYNTGDLIKLSADGKQKITIGASFANDSTGGQGFDFSGKPDAKSYIYAGAVSYNGEFGFGKVFAVGVFQHQDQINLFNVSGSVALLGDTLNINGGATIKTFGDLIDDKTNKKGKAIISIYGGADYKINKITVSGGAHFGHQDKFNEFNFGVAGAYDIVPNVKWTIAQANVDMIKNDDADLDEAVYGVESKLEIDF